MPPDSSEGYFCAVSSGSPTMVSLTLAISSISAWDMWVYSRSGTWIFWATVWDENSAPSWNSTPQRISSARISWPSTSPVCWPNTSITPSRGGLRPMMERSSTDLPAPEPPTTPITSPR